MHFSQLNPRVLSGAAKTFLSLIQRLPAALLFSPKQITHITDFLCCTTIYVDTILYTKFDPTEVKFKMRFYMISRITENKNETNNTYYLFDEDMILKKIELKTKEHNVVNNTKHDPK